MQELDELRREASEEQMKMVADIKLERGDLSQERERVLADMKSKEEELERKLKEINEQTDQEIGRAHV